MHILITSWWFIKVFSSLNQQWCIKVLLHESSMQTVGWWNMSVFKFFVNCMILAQAMEDKKHLSYKQDLFNPWRIWSLSWATIFSQFCSNVQEKIGLFTISFCLTDTLYIGTSGFSVHSKNLPTHESHERSWINIHNLIVVSMMISPKFSRLVS